MPLAWNDIINTAIVLFFIIDPLGNIPLFNSLLSHLPPRQRMLALLRECSIAMGILMFFLFAGGQVLEVLGLSQSSLNLSGGILLFIIAIRMVFPGRHESPAEAEAVEDPLVVPLAMPMFAGPSALAIVMLEGTRSADNLLAPALSIGLAGVAATLILVPSPYYMQMLGQRGLRALERLMGMLLIMMAVQMLLNGIREYFHSLT